ncbi:MAG: efflux RND transporter periplasmic adaptor subunit [Rhodanobacteraceae bacterium]|nr:MAG: efflux RND transporter periplasmic adaptor subunit [Rhodanobacteraceae bacterium]
MKRRRPRFCRRRIPLALAATVALFLAACSSNHAANNAAPPVAVSVAMPVQQTFHTRIVAFGELAADSRGAWSLSLPQAGQVIATEALAGQHVQRGAPLLKLQTDPAARSAYLQARSAVAAARGDLTRVEHLYAEKLATSTQLAAARKALADAAAALDAQARLGGAIAVATLAAPADGVVTALDVQRGQRIPAGTRLLEFTPRHALVAQLEVDPAAAGGIHTGMPAALQPVYAAQGAPPLAATVAMVGDAVNPATHRVGVIATLDRAVALPTGTALSASIVTASFKAWAVPREALESDAHGSYIFQIEHGKAQRVNVKVLAPAGSPVGVAGALDPRAPVITLGSYEVSGGDAVMAAPAKSHGTATR